MPSPERAGHQDVTRVDRQQRGDTAEQHGEQIERDGAENGRVAADEADAGEQIVGRRPLRIRGRGRLHRRKRAHECRGQQAEDGHDAVGQARRERIGQPAQ
jgi:hypothetical protein